MEQDKDILEKIAAAVERRKAIEAARPEIPTDQQIAEWGATDLWYLCRHIIGWEFYDDPYAIYFCEEVQNDPDRLFLVARGHLKSLTITCAGTIQHLINNPDHSVAIISYNATTAKSFLSQIKRILETNELLKKVYPDKFYQSPSGQSTSWSELNGINIIRKTTRKEPSVYAFGLIDSQRTGMHSDLLVFDDIIIQESVSSPAMIQKATSAWELSDNLGMTNQPTRARYCGTRYHYYDTYREIMSRGIPFLKIPATHDGTLNGKPIFMSEEALADKIKKQGNYTFSCQMLLTPVAAADQKFNVEDLVYYDDPKEIPPIVNRYLIVDPGKGKERSDYTSMGVVGYDANGDLWLIDGLYDKLGLGRRWNCLLDLWEKNGVCLCGYEQYGMTSDDEYFDMEIKRKRMKFPPFKVLGGISNKEDRILRLVPLLEQRRLHIPRQLVRTSYYDGRDYNMIPMVVQELADFPFGKHDDFLDMLSRIFDIIPVLPRERGATEETIDDMGLAMLRDNPNKAKQHVGFLRKVGNKIGRWAK